MPTEPIIPCITRLAEPVVTSLGLVIWGVELVRGGRTVVRLFVDMPHAQADSPHTSHAAPGHTPAATRDVPENTEGMPLISPTVDHCEEISRHLSLALDVENCFSEPYVLEVSTPGLSRQFFHLAQMLPYVGDMVEARLLTPLDSHDPQASRRVWRGTLLHVEDHAFVLAPASVTPEGHILPEDVPPVRIPWSAVRRVNRLHVFQRAPKPGKGGATGKKISTPPRTAVGGSHES